MNTSRSVSLKPQHEICVSTLSEKNTETNNNQLQFPKVAKFMWPCLLRDQFLKREFCAVETCFAPDNALTYEGNTDKLILCGCVSCVYATKLRQIRWIRV